MSIRSGSDAVALLGLIVGTGLPTAGAANRDSEEGVAAPIPLLTSTGFVSR
jgi:hypothetical protein